MALGRYRPSAVPQAAARGSDPERSRAAAAAPCVRRSVAPLVWLACSRGCLFVSLLLRLYAGLARLLVCYLVWLFVCLSSGWLCVCLFLCLASVARFLYCLVACGFYFGARSADVELLQLRQARAE